MRHILCGIILALLPLQAFGLNGVYLGTITPDDELGLEPIPLQVSLMNTGESVTLPGGDTRSILQGSFVLGSEGGPYSFSQVNLQLENGWIEFLYFRPQLDIKKAPANLRLFGTIDGAGRIAGTAYSAAWGKLGRFTLSKSSSSSLVVSREFAGRWRGRLYPSEGGEQEITLNISARGGTTKNPPDFELDYTPGLSGSLQKEGIWFKINVVQVDYLRQKVLLSQTNAAGTAGFTMELKYDPSRGTLEGNQMGIWRNDRARVVFEKVASQESGH